MRELKDKKWVAVRTETWLTMNKIILEIAEREKKHVFYADVVANAIELYAKELAEKWKQAQAPLKEATGNKN